MFESFIADEDGIIAWRRGTGDNVELTYILVKNKCQGEGTRLFIRMLNKLAVQPPYYTVYGFTRLGNEAAITFYESLGFVVRQCLPVYRDGGTVMFCAPYEELVARNCR